MRVYKFNKDGYFTGVHDCQVGCFGETLFPSGDFTEKAPNIVANKIPKFDGSKWVNKTDYRGRIIYNKLTLEKSTYQNIEKYSNDFTELAPPSQIYKWSGGKWIIDEIKQAEKEQKEIAQELASTDNEIIRGVEDLIDLLIAKNVIAENDLPQKLKEKLDNRKVLRSQINE